ncbi:fluoride efflux transporter FluC [Mesobacillus jeotgali]|uniref:fluoride efflux transporter FluC n=1 Tax=Mesobacillus jeotgali TaxID=129985 RepID=UPI0009A8DE3E|nr:CrcB family protein [Mesobacillus jeotgali]
MIELFLVACGGLGGAVSRLKIQKMFETSIIPVATLVVNLLGSFLLGLIAGVGIQGNLFLLTATGFMGAFTTFSTLNVDLVKLFSNKQSTAGIQYIFITYIGGLLCVGAGLFLGRLV